MASFNLKFDTANTSSIGVTGARAVERYVCTFDTKIEPIGNPYDVAFARKPRGTLHSNPQLAALAVQVQEIEVGITSAPEVFYVDVIYGQPGSIPWTGLWSFAKIGTLEQEPYAVDAEGKWVGGNVYWPITVDATHPLPQDATTLTTPDGTAYNFKKFSRNVTVRASNLTRSRPVSAFVLRGESLVAMSYAISDIDQYKQGVNDSEFYGFPAGTVHFAGDQWETTQQTVGIPGGKPEGQLPAAAVFNVELQFEVDPRGWDQTIVDHIPLPDKYGIVHDMVVTDSQQTFVPYGRMNYSGILRYFTGMLTDRPGGSIRP